MKNKLFVFFITISCLLTSNVFAEEKDPDIKETVKYLDQMFKKYGSCTAVDNNGRRKYKRNFIGLYVVGGQFNFRQEYSEFFVDQYGEVLQNKHANAVTFNLKRIESISVEEAKNEINNPDACETWVWLSCTSSDCLQDTYTNRASTGNRSNNEGTNTSTVHLIPLKSDIKTSTKIISAMQHLWKLHDIQLKNSTLNEELF